MATPIFKAILRNDELAFLNLVLEKPSVLDERNHGESLAGTVLHLAVEVENRELVATIINLNPSLIRSTNSDGDTPLHLAARLGHASIVTQMLESGQAASMALNGLGETPFCLACNNNHPDTARLILEETSSITIVEFYATILQPSADLARLVLGKFPKLAWNIDGEMSTPLHLACNMDNIDVVKMLLELDEKLAERVNRNGFTPLHLAVMKCSVPILKEFLDKAPRSFDTLTPAKETVFHLAAEHKNTAAFIFMAKNSDLNELLNRTDKKGNTVLHTAASVACFSVVNYIIYETTIDLTAKNKWGFAATDFVNKYEHRFLASLLKIDAEKIRNPQAPSKYSFEQVTPQPKPVTQTVVKTYNPQLLYMMKRLERQIVTDPPNREREMHAEALQSARNTITIVAVLIATVAFTCGISPPGGVYQEGPSIGKSTVGGTLAFKIFSLSNNLALCTSLCIVILLVSIIPYRTKPLMNFLVITHRMMWVAVSSMATAYLAAAWIIVPHLGGTRWLFYAILAISIVTLGGLFVYLGYKLVTHMSKKAEWKKNIASVPVAPTTTVVPTTTVADNWSSAAADRGAAEAEGYYIY